MNTTINRDTAIATINNDSFISHFENGTDQFSELKTIFR